MAEQVLKKMRIQLRRATTAEWETYKDVVPTAGEPCFDLELNTLKIGDGTHKYSELDFVYAKAADVVAACKSESALTTFVNNVISNAGIATNEALTTLAGRVTTAEGEIDALQTNVAANTSDIATLKGTGDGSVAKAVSDAVSALDVEDAAVAHQVVTAVSETDGKIAVTRAQLTTDDIAAGTEVWIFDCGTSAV